MKEQNKQVEELSKKLKALRVEKGISAAELARKIGRKKEYVYAFEHGRSELKMNDYLAICEALNISPQALLVGRRKNLACLTVAEQLETLSNRDFTIVKNLLAMMTLSDEQW